MEIVNKKVIDLKPYKNNARKNDNAVEYVANSIKEFGFKNPIILDKNNVIIAGHTRYKASKKLGLKEVPCIIADDLTEEQVKALRLADNKTGEIAEWDFDLLNEELADILDIDMDNFGFFDVEKIEWNEIEDLNEDIYDKPIKDMLECPNCHHIDSKIHFKKIDGVEVTKKTNSE